MSNDEQPRRRTVRRRGVRWEDGSNPAALPATTNHVRSDAMQQEESSVPHYGALCPIGVHFAFDALDKRGDVVVRFQRDDAPDTMYRLRMERDEALRLAWDVLAACVEGEVGRG